MLIVSEDLEELFEISDRIAVISKGRLSPAMRTGETTVADGGRLMAGISAREPASELGDAT